MEPDEFDYDFKNEAAKQLPEYGPSIFEPHIESLNKLIDAKSQEIAIDYSLWMAKEVSYMVDDGPNSLFYLEKERDPLTAIELFLKYKQSLNVR